MASIDNGFDVKREAIEQLIREIDWPEDLVIVVMSKGQLHKLDATGIDYLEVIKGGLVHVLQMFHLLQAV